VTHIGIVVGSTRPGRVGHQVAQWVADHGARRGDATVEIVDVADHALPVFDEPGSPLLGEYEHEHTRAWSRRIAAFDGYVFVTPEYNRSVPAALKNAIDYLYREWNDKAAAFVSYGSNVGGARAVEHLRVIAAGLRLADVRTEVNLSLATDFEGYARFAPDPRHEAALGLLFTELTAWSGALAALRRP
jgi:NAD(P)H-dependent FMN reductase